MTRTAPFLILLLALALAACATRTPAPDAHRAAVQRGQAFVLRACAGCHATQPTGASANPHAPPFRELAARRNDAELARAVGEISRNGHVEMPPIYVTPDEMADVVAYMRSLTGRVA